MKESLATQVFRGEIFYFSDDPAVKGDSCVHHYEDGLLIIEDSLVVSCQDAKNSPLAKNAVRLEGLIIPGMVDTHVHYPQLSVLASPAIDLLDWLHTHTFPSEAAFSDPAHASREAVKFLDAMLAAGTTTALVFATTHACSADALFKEAYARNLRLITGKVLSDVNMPKELRDTPKEAFDESLALIKKWHGKQRLGYAVTPRFALSSSIEQLEAAGKLLEMHKDVLLHTHLSESHNEIEEVRKLHPNARDYVDVYDKTKLVNDRSVFAHSIHLSDDEWSVIEQNNAALSHCPCSNLFLGSGLFNAKEATRRNIRFALGSDIGGGTNLSMFTVMDEAYKVAKMRQNTIDPLRLWYLATLGGARVLGLDKRIGSFQKGCEADFVVFDPKQIPLLANRFDCAKTIEEKLFALALLGDERAVAHVYIMGEKKAGSAN